MATAALLLTGCGGDDDGGNGVGGFVSGGASGGAPDGGSGGADLELETTGGFGDGGGDGDGDAAPPAPGGGDSDWYAHCESSDGITLYTTPEGVLYGNSETGDVCTQSSGMMGSLDWEPVLFNCEVAGLKNVRFELNGDTVSLEWSDRTEEATKVESLAGQTVDLDALMATL
ncbi:hypothetical protein ACWGIB_21525 [Streptomyces xiamenensis]